MRSRRWRRTLFTRDRDSVVFKVSDVGVLLVGALEQFQPKLAQRLPEGASAELVKLNTEGSPLKFAQVAEDVDDVYWLMLVLALVCWLGALALSTERRRTFVHIGVGLATTTTRRRPSGTPSCTICAPGAGRSRASAW